MTALVFGYFDLNFGDDWLIHEFAREYNKKEVILVVSDEKLFVPFEKNSLFKSVRYVGKMNALWCCNEVNIVGGSMFQEGGNWFLHYSKIFCLLAISRALGKKNHIVGCNLNAIDNKKLKFIFWLIFKQVNYFRVRDLTSAKILAYEYGISSNKIELKHDLADKPKHLTNLKKENSCAISIINNKSINKDKYFEWLSTNIIDLQEKGVSVFKFYAFDTGSESDETIIDEFFKIHETLFEQSVFSKHIYKGSVDLFIKEWSESKYALCTRFHSYILARNCSQKFKVYCYSDKIVQYIISHHPVEMEFVDAP